MDGYLEKYVRNIRISNSIDVLRMADVSETKIKEIVMDYFQISGDEVDSYMTKAKELPEVSNINCLLFL